MSNKLTCRKCGGEHLTIKCKPITSIDTNIDTNIATENSTIIADELPIPKIVLDESKVSKYETRYERPKNTRSSQYNKTHTVKLSELPLDISESELYGLLENWGHITKIRVLLYSESSTAYIEFIYQEEAEYFVKAMHKTPFDSFIISAELCVDKDRSDRF